MLDRSLRFQCGSPRAATAGPTAEAKRGAPSTLPWPLSSWPMRNRRTSAGSRGGCPVQVAVVPLSEERLRLARRALRECVHLQPIRSHIAQALAAGLGFCNDAALRARMRARPDAVAPFEPAAFCRRLVELKSPCAEEDHRRVREAVAASAAAAGDGWSRIDAYIAHIDQKALVAPWFADICSAPQLHAMRRSRLDRSVGLRIFCGGHGESHGPHRDRRLPVSSTVRQKHDRDRRRDEEGGRAERTSACSARRSWPPGLVSAQPRPRQPRPPPRHRAGPARPPRPPSPPGARPTPSASARLRPAPGCPPSA